MNNEFTQKLLEYLQRTEDFALEQLPDIFLQALRYHKISAWLSIFLMIVVISGLICLMVYFCKYPTLDSYGHRDFVSFYIPFMVPFIALACFVSLCISVDRLIKIYVAPKYYLISLIAGTLNGK